MKAQTLSSVSLPLTAIAARYTIAARYRGDLNQGTSDTSRSLHI